VKLPIKKLLVLKKKVKTQQKNHIAVLKCEITDKKNISIFVFARQELSGTYQIRSSSSSDMDLIILVERKKNPNN
jgi:hypothetical protein